MNNILKRSFSTAPLKQLRKFNHIHVNFSRVSEKVDQSRYSGQIQTVILDWSGTTIDPYVLSVATPIRETFKYYGVPITNKQARKPMGKHKFFHIKEITEDEDVMNRWESVHRRKIEASDVLKLFDNYSERQLSYLRKQEMTTLLPTVKESVDLMRRKLNINVGSTSGFLKNMQTPILESVKRQGYIPDATVAADDIIRSRPYPDGIWTNMLKLNTSNNLAAVKVDDTVLGIQEGLNAGVWTVGFSRYNNFMGEQGDDPQFLDKLEKEDPAKFRDILDKSNGHLKEAQPEFIIESFDQLPTVINMINMYQTQRNSNWSQIYDDWITIKGGNI